jgi:uncharacterized protein YeaO (DUF488 family)
VTSRKPVVSVRRIYDEPLPGHAARVLVDRLWPRGVSKERAALDEWCKEVAPSDELRRFAHTGARHEEFRRRYEAELDEPERAKALDHLRDLARTRGLVLVTATREVERGHAAVILRRLAAAGPRPAGGDGANVSGPH